MVHPRAAHQCVRRLPADEPHDVADRPRLSPGRHGAVARLRFADHACRRGARLARHTTVARASRAPPPRPMHAPVAPGSHEIRLPPACRVFKGRHDRLFSNRISYVWTPLQSKVDKVMTNFRWWRLQQIARSALEYT